MKLGPWYGCSHPVDKTIYKDRGMVAAIQKDSGMVTAIQLESHVYNHELIHATQTCVILVRGLESQPIIVQFLTCE